MVLAVGRACKFTGHWQKDTYAANPHSEAKPGSHLSAAAREQQHRLALAQQLVGRHGRGLDSAKALKQLPLRPLPVLGVRQAARLQAIHS